ncbi:NPCBM/NEW2 domain-containing protein [Streptomyces sp. NPDC054887]
MKHRPLVRRRITAAALAVTVSVSLAVTALTVSAPTASALDNGQGRTPQMGWNSWNAFRCDINESKIKAAADAIVSSGLKAVGYQYVNIDDCWQAPERDASGRLQPDPIRFPSGIAAIADYVHAKGLKLGIYATPGTRTCANIWDNYPGRLGSLGHESQDAQTFASWGVDYLKYDWCQADQDGVNAEQAFTKMRDALAATDRPVFYSIHREPQLPVDSWRPAVANSWRTTPDIRDTWSSMIGIARANQPLASYARPGAWNDPDMLEVGNGGMTPTEYRTHMSLWAMMAAPLLMGTDLTTATAATLDILGNRDVIAVDQDLLGRQGTVVSRTGDLVVMSKSLADGSQAVTLTNEGAATATISTTAQEIGIGGASSYSLKDLWSKATSTTSGTISASVAPHATVMYRVTPSAQVAPGTGVHQLSDLTWTSQINGWGPVERNLSNGEQAAGDGRALTINGTSYTKGLGVHAASEITYFLGGNCTSFTAQVGVDDEVATNGSVVFQAFRDGVKVADSGLLTGADAARSLSANVVGGKELKLVVTDGGNGKPHDHADWADAKLSCGTGPSAGTHALSDLTWTSQINGWGPVERNLSNGEQAAGDGRALTINGTSYTKGLGVHAASEITYFLGGNCTSFTAQVGVDDEVATNGSVVFQAFRDGVKVADSGLLTGADAARSLSANVVGGKELKLVVTDGGNGKPHDHADWADAKLSCG